jgi:hypothetical protein
VPGNRGRSPYNRISLARPRNVLALVTEPGD